MPGLLTMRPSGAASKTRSSSSRTLARSKAERTRDERAPSQSTTLVSVPSANLTSVRPSQLQACGPAARSKAVESATEKVRTRFFGSGAQVDRVENVCSSSGSEHEPSSVCLAAMVDDFMERETENGSCGRSRCKCEVGTCTSYSCFNDDEDSKSYLGGELSEILQGLVPCSNVTERILLTEVKKALAAAEEVTSTDVVTTCFRRQVMKHLRSAGYNAAICKSRWDYAGCLPGGDYEYIDVLFEGATGKSERILIDVDFKAQFEIARPTARHNAIVQVLPTIFIGKTDRLQQIVNVMCEAVKLSLKKRGMHLPPWRKPEYFCAKWFSSYRRTTNSASHKKDDGEVIDIGRIAVRGSEWDARFIDEMEVDFQRAEARQVMKNCIDIRTVNVSGKRPQNSAAVQSTIDNSAWELPTVKPRVFLRPGPDGLASILRQAGLTESIRKLNEAQGSERRSLAMTK